MHVRRVAGFVVFAAIACTRPTAEIGPAPEPSPAAAPPAPEPKAIVRDVRCWYGGPRPRFFVWFDLEARALLRKLHGATFTIGDGAGGFVEGVERPSGDGVLTLRTRSGAGRGPVPGEVAVGEHLQLELFGPLRTASLGAGATYPTEDRSFRARIEADGGVELTLEGTCVVGPGPH